jgi:putative oxidoreductase
MKPSLGDTPSQQRFLPSKTLSGNGGYRLRFTFSVQLIALKEIVMEGNKYVPLLGRIFLGVPFLMSGLGKLGAYAGTVGYISAVGLPVAPLAFIVAVAIEVGGGLLLLSGYRVRLASLVMAVFSLATAFFFHRNFGDQNQMIHFLKNVMIAGGLLQIAYFGAGAWSLDARTANSTPRKAALGAN